MIEKLQRRVSFSENMIVCKCWAGLCMEKQLPTLKSKYKVAEWHEQIIKCFEIAGDLTLVYLQEQDKLAMQPQNGTSVVNSSSIGRVVGLDLYYQ